jgi:putative hydrolase of the HAD superfamily
MRQTARAPFEGVLLDLYGTLVPAGPRASRAPHLFAMAQLLGAEPGRFENDWATSLGDRVFGRLGSLEDAIVNIAGRQGLLPSPERIQQAVDVRLAFCRSTLESCGPLLPQLDALLGAGIRLAVVSDCSEETARLWSASLLGQRIKATAFSCVVGTCKPDPRMYRLALQQLGLPADRCAFVGDGGSRELTGATEVGLTAYRYRFPGDRGLPDSRYDPDTEWRGPMLEDLRDLLSPAL